MRAYTDPLQLGKFCPTNVEEYHEKFTVSHQHSLRKKYLLFDDETIQLQITTVLLFFKYAIKILSALKARYHCSYRTALSEASGSVRRMCAIERGELLCTFRHAHGNACGRRVSWQKYHLHGNVVQCSDCYRNRIWLRIWRRCLWAANL